MNRDAEWHELCATFSVRDHVYPGAFVAEALLYDRLIIPVIATQADGLSKDEARKEWDRWAVESSAADQAGSNSAGEARRSESCRFRGHRISKASGPSELPRSPARPNRSTRAILACAINERMARKLDYVQEEVRVLREAPSPRWERRELPLPSSSGSAWPSRARPHRLAEAWTQMLESVGVQSVPIPASSPNCNPHAERFVRSVRSECLEHFVIFGERQLRYLLREFVEHYHTERYHQGLAGRLIRSRTAPSNDNCSRGDIAFRSRLGGPAQLLSQVGRVILTAAISGHYALRNHSSKVSEVQLENGRVGHDVSAEALPSVQCLVSASRV